MVILKIELVEGMRAIIVREEILAHLIRPDNSCDRLGKLIVFVIKNVVT